MKRRILTEPVEVTGADVFGRKAKIKFTPISHTRGWQWQVGRNGGHMPLSLAHCRYTPFPFRTISAVEGKRRIHILEHIAALRWTGLSGIRVTSDPWPPFHGRTWDLLEELRPYMATTDEDMSWVKGRAAKVEHQKIERGEIEYKPCDQSRLELKVAIDYPGLGFRSYMPKLPSTDLFKTYKAIYAGLAAAHPIFSAQADTLATPGQCRLAGGT